MPIKTRPTLYTKESVENSRRNIERYDWAKKIRDSAVEKADEILEKWDYDFLWGLVPPQTLPRSFTVQYDLGSPVTGKKFLREYGQYAWELDPEGYRWKILDPSSGYMFPTNDFEAFYKSGLDEEGIFQRELADESLLVNELYPEKGPGWGVDDGYGWDDEEGNRWVFIAYYNHWTYRRTMQGAVEAFRDAYLYTGDQKYSRAGLILLDRVADLYPTYDVSEWDWDEGYKNSHGGTGEGKFLGSIWAVPPIKAWVSSYDAFFDAVDDPELLSFLSDKAEEYSIEKPKKTGDDLRRNIEEGVLLEVLPAVKTAKIRGNHGMHESVLAMTAVVLDQPGTEEEPGLTREILDFAFQPGRFEHKKMRITGGNLMGTLLDDIDRDGMGTETAPNYNGIWVSGIRLVADILEGYDGYEEADLYENVKFKKLLTAHHKLLMLDKYTPQIGDSQAVANTSILMKLGHYVKAFDKYREIFAAQVADFLSEKTGRDIHGDISSKDAQDIARDIREVVEKHGPWVQKSVNMTGYGFTALRDGEEDEGKDTRRGFWIYYGRNGTGHAHGDNLNIDIYAHGLSLAADNGYPDKGSAFPRRSEWLENTISHNTVMVNRRRQNRVWVGLPHHYDDNDCVKMIDIDSPRAYEETDLYRRTTAMIRVDEENSYLVDFFRIQGGNEHHFSFHATEGDAAVRGLNLEKQDKGTLAGKDVPKGKKIDESGFHYLTNVSKDEDPSSLFSVDWAVDDFRGVAPESEDVHLRLTMLSDVDTAVLADGQPPQKAGNPEKQRYLVVERKGEDISSEFTSVIEPYQKERFIKKVEAVDIEDEDSNCSGDDVKAVRITLEDGRIHYVVSSINQERTYIIDGKYRFRGFFGLISIDSSGELAYIYGNDADLIEAVDGSFSGKDLGCVSGNVVDFTRDLSMENEIIIELKDDLSVDLEELIGRYIYVENDGVRNASYMIEDVEVNEGGRISIDIGDYTLIREHKNKKDFEQGYSYDIAEGAEFRIPLSWEIR